MSPTMVSPSSPSVSSLELENQTFDDEMYQRPFFNSTETSSLSSLTSIISNYSLGNFAVDNMAPKTVVFQYHMSHPETWAKFCLNNDNPGDLYFSMLPVPGIYSVMPKKHRYLVALKPNGKFDNECIFSSHQHFGSQLYDTSYPRSATSSNSSSQSDLTTSENAPRSSTSSNSSSQTDISTASNSSRSTVSSVLSTRSIRFAEDKTAVQEQPKPTKHHKFDYHHQKTTSKTSLSSTLSKSKAAKLQKCDINGYKPLHKPLRIKFCKILDRWMFKSEIEERMLETVVCSCEHRDPRCCKNGVWKDFTALDDAFSWVMVKKGEEKKVNGERILYCVDEETNCMRKQDKLEAKKSWKRLELVKGGNQRNMFFDEGSDYMAVLRYLGLGCREN